MTTPPPGSAMRVFPRRTKATPDDNYVCIGAPSIIELITPWTEAHISVTFSWDVEFAERIAEVFTSWADGRPVKVGGPAMGEAGDVFVPGRYLKHGYVITSRGCPNRCWFCSVWQREGQNVRELPIVEGWNVLDDNLLACSDEHVRAVFAMLKRQKQRVEFTGGLEAARLKQWHVDLLRDLKPKQMFFAYDTPDDLEPLQQAGKMLLASGFTTTSHALRAYVLIGHPRDTFDDAEKRLRQTVVAGFLPMAMLWRDALGKTAADWRRLQRTWARPALTSALLGGT